MSEEDELEKLREERMEELQGDEAEAREEQVEQQKQQIWEEAKSYMTKDARERLSNVKMVKEQLALSVARQIARLGNSGQVGKVDEQQMKNILKSIQGEKENSQSNIKFRK